jgi:hypothetical protein
LWVSSDEDLFDYQLARLRSVPLIKENWLAGAKDVEKDAQILKVNEAKLLYYQGKEAAQYFMGMAYLEGWIFRKPENSSKRFSTPYVTANDMKKLTRRYSGSTAD